MTECYDLHCHSLASDGALTPTELVERAQQQGVTTLALTDHDTTAGLEEARLAASAVNIQLLNGIELSTTWNNKCLHIIGLNINPDYQPLVDGCATLQNIRTKRAEKIAVKLEKKRIPDALEAVKRSAGNGMITRPHFANFLVSQNHVSTPQEAFDRYLAKGKSAFVATQWIECGVAINWITQSGGIAVLAHPMRYKLTTKWMSRLLSEFKEMGGQAMEVVCGRSNPDELHRLANYAQKFELAGSAGSDFHSPQNQWVELGRLKPMPENVQPVWELFS